MLMFNKGKKPKGSGKENAGGGGGQPRLDGEKFRFF